MSFCSSEMGLCMLTMLVAFKLVNSWLFSSHYRVVSLMVPGQISHSRVSTFRYSVGWQVKHDLKLE